jgi:hypothetical protein
MVDKKRRLRMFFVDEEDSIHRFPLSKYSRIHGRTEPIYLFTGKTVHFIEAHVEVDENGEEQNGEEQLVGAHFIKHTFDAKGLWDEDQKKQELVGAMEAAAHFGSSEWNKIYRAEHIEPFR